MADSDITVSGLTAKGGISQIALTWSTPVDLHTPGGLTFLQKAAIEVWAASENDRDASSQIGEQPDANSFLHADIDRGAEFYYWLRPRNRAGLFGDWFPLSPAAGIHGVESNSDVLLAETGYFKNKNGLIDQWGTAVTNEEPFGVTTVTYPLVFPNQSFSPSITPLINVGFIFGVRDTTTSGFTMDAYGLEGFGSEAGIQRTFGAFPFSWLAKGY